MDNKTTTAALVLMIATTNVFNRLNLTTRQVAGPGGERHGTNR